MKPGEALQAWREKRGLSQMDASALINPAISQSAWSDWETGNKPPNLTNAFEIERITGGEIKASWWSKPTKAKRRGARGKAA